MSEIEQAQQAISSFLSQKMTKTIEEKQKKEKDKFTEEKAQEIRDKYEPTQWLNYICENIDKVFLNVSHIAKLTHSSSQASNLKDNIPQNQYLYLITTQTANANVLDRGYADAKYAPIAEFLTYPVENSNKQLGEFLCENEQCFAKISDNQTERQAWCDAIKNAYTPKNISSHTLAKQIYVPINDECEYHLISPMYSSSLAQHIFDVIDTAHNKENPAKIAKENNQYHQDESIRFPNMATLGVTKSNHQNASALNGKRRGQLHLFCALPPQIKANPNPPHNKDILLNHCYSACKNDLNDIKDLLYMVKKQGLFLDYDKKQVLVEHIQNIAEKILNAMLIIRQNQIHGWTNELSMPMYLRLFLDKDIQKTHSFSQPEYMKALNDLAGEIAQWINRYVDENNPRALHNLWVKIILPILQMQYLALTAE